MNKKNKINHLLTIKEVAEELRVGPRTVYRLIEAGKIKPFKLSSKAYRVPREELNRFLERTLKR